MTDAPFELRIDDQELNLVDKFRQSRNTSVLTIMFTDIQGFTRLTEERGDAFSNEVRRAHDGLLVPIIERDGSGRVIKHIGDAVMAVFAEPSTAVARALEIQEALRKYSAAHSDQPPLLVRIGLHMGQVTVEDKMSLDIFGRHVNRASRVEGLAEGGHVYLTYSVFDSAKGWLSEGKEAAWVSHGRYQVKGIDEPLEIFEAYRPGAVKPRPPQAAKKQTSLPRFAPAAGLVLAGALAMLMLLGLGRTKVTFEDLGVQTDNTAVMLDQGTRLQLDGLPDDPLRKCLTTIKPGNHLLYYDVSSSSRYYALLIVKRGKNILHPQFENFDLPGLERTASYEKHGQNTDTFMNSTDYATYDDAGVRHDHKANISLTLKSAPGDLVPAANGVKSHHSLFWTIQWEVDLDGQKISADQLIVEHDPSAVDPTEGKKDLWGDARHKYGLSYRLADTNAQVSILAQYAEYK
jgi:class 3 adenylate cyclase